ncbi:MAG: cysteine desulfurase family protein [Simkaniaceae bacterium]
MKKRLYFDYNATTPLHPRVIDALILYLSKFHGNPSSLHQDGQNAKKILNNSRTLIADFLGVREDEIFFTSGCTEALNHLLTHFQKNYTIFSSKLEHAAVYEVIKDSAEFLSTDETLQIPKEKWKELEPGSLLVLSYANSETGMITPIEEIGAYLASRGIPFLVDGAQALGKIPFKIPKGVTAMTFSAHKFGGPKGVGFFFLKKGIKLSPFIKGGQQELFLRAGTENLMGIVGMSAAIKSVKKEGFFSSSLRDHFEKTLLTEIPSTRINGIEPRLPNTSNIAFLGLPAEEILIHLDLEGIAASHGSACASGSLEPSRVLINMGYDLDRVRSSIRFSFGYGIDKDSIDEGVLKIAKIIKHLRQVSGSESLTCQ